MGYFNHPLWELIFSILGNSGRSPGAHWRTSYLDKADIPCPRTCLGEDDAFTGDLYVQWNSKESVLEKDETELDAMNINDLERLWLFLCPEFECKGNSVCYKEIEKDIRKKRKEKRCWIILNLIIMESFIHRLKNDAKN